jgi:hypothetical protein
MAATSDSNWNAIDAACGMVVSHMSNATGPVWPNVVT